jgi:hypothetical protein
MERYDFGPYVLHPPSGTSLLFRSYPSVSTLRHQDIQEASDTRWSTIVVEQLFTLIRGWQESDRKPKQAQTGPVLVLGKER